jgi:hypothetical protein
MLSAKFTKWTVAAVAAGLLTVAPAIATQIKHTKLSAAKHATTSKLLAATTAPKAKTVTHGLKAKAKTKITAKPKLQAAHHAKPVVKSAKKHTATAKTAPKTAHHVDKSAPVLSNM